MFSGLWGPCEIDQNKERLWLLGFLKKKCQEIDVEEEYISYEKRIRSNALIAFLVLHSVITIVDCIILLMTCMYPHMIYIDVAMYLMACMLLFIVLSVNLIKNSALDSPWTVYTTSVLSTAILVLVDLFILYYHRSADNWKLITIYDTYILFVIYLFLPLRGIKAPLLLGSVVSIVYSVDFLIFKTLDSKYEITTLMQVLNIVVGMLDNICFNLLGAFFRIMSDIIIRSSFVDRHQYVMADISLKNARKHEMLLLHSILPPQIAQPFQDDIRSRVAKYGKRHSNATLPTRDHIMAIQSHLDVSILYADVVNYTYLTTTLPVQELVVLLHELYATFDYAASHFGTQRIKFLGDCYYCVAGLLKSDPDHAKCCINLGHSMIAHIRKVRQTRDLNIDMRIGIHSGSILAGVIGSAKLQYDIWGDDAVIANKLESTGTPGYLHISDTTLSMMFDHNYEILPGTDEARDDPYLRKYNIQTYLIAAIDNTDGIAELENDDFYNTDASHSERDTKDIKAELRQEFEKMPIGSFASWDNCFRFGKPISKIRRSKPLIGVIFMDFRDPALEYHYTHQPDYMFKYSALLGWCVFLSLMVVQSIDQHHMRHVKYSMDFLFLSIQSIIVLTLWYKTICIWRYYHRSHQYSSVSCTIFFIGEFIQRNLICRMFVFMIFLTMYAIIIYLILTDCDLNEYAMLHIEAKLYLYEIRESMCFHPWVLTKMVCLIVGVTMIFTGIPYVVKIMMGFLEVIAYFIIIFFQYIYLIHNSSTSNPFLPPEFAHSMLVLITLIVMLYMQRQVEFNNKVNYSWKVELLKKQEDNRITNKTITILLRNILPRHVVNVYLTLKEKHELYYENYEMVAVMFASIKNFHMDMSKLRFLNEIISEFDAVLSQYKNEFLVDKIKIVGCTYMAACGLDVHKVENHVYVNFNTTSLKKEISRAQDLLARGPESERIKNEEVVFILTCFALDLMRTLWVCKNVFKSIPLDSAMIAGDMSIGISSGEVMAGVVGASQVHYDIWGNAVNMASRMDSTGVAGYIQVTEESAKILMRCGIQCDYRGMTFVKGRGILPTYFVGIDDNLEFKRHEE